MAGRRGSIQRRQPDPSRKPPEKERVERGGAPMFHDSGRVVIPLDGRVTIFQGRFPCNGFVRHATLRLRNLSENVGVVATFTLNGDVLFVKETNEQTMLVRLPNKIAVDEHSFVTVQLTAADATDAVSLDADIAYLFQDTPRANIQNPVR